MKNWDGKKLHWDSGWRVNSAEKCGRLNTPHQTSSAQALDACEVTRFAVTSQK